MAIIGNILLPYGKEWLFVCPTAIIGWLPTPSQWHPLFIKLCQGGTSIMVHSTWWRKHSQHSWVSEHIFTTWGSSSTVTTWSQGQLPTEDVTTSIYLLLHLIWGGGEVHHMASSSARGETGWGGPLQLSDIVSLYHNFLNRAPIYNAIFPNPGRSWPFIELLYHTLKAINWFNLPLKIQFITT